MSLWLALACFLCSCTKYQYVHLSSDTLPRTELNEFVAEHDSFRVVYRFDGTNAPLQVGIVNKSATALQVDWNQSFLTKNNKRFSLFTPKWKIKEKKEAGDNGYTLQVNDITRQQPVERILPGSSLNKESVDIIRSRFIKPGAGKKKEKVVLDGYSRTLKKAGFTQASSPLVFSLHLVLQAEGEGKQPASLDHSFYISGLQTTKIPPRHMTGKADVVQVQKQTVTGAILGAGGLLVILIVKGWLDELLSDSE